MKDPHGIASTVSYELFVGVVLFALFGSVIIWFAGLCLKAWRG